MLFNSPENNELLLGLLSHNTVYLNYPRFFMKSFHDNIKSIQNEMSGATLMEMNKVLIKNMSNIVKTQEKTQEGTQEQTLDKNEIFQKKLAAHEKNFSESINIKKPEEIDFSDNIEDGEIKDIDKTMRQREKELAEIMSSYGSTNASEWLSSKETRTPNLNIQEKNVKIDTIDLAKKPKKVRFDIKNDGIKSLLGKLKKNTEQGKDMVSSEDIKKILFNQKLILEKLEKIEKNYMNN